MRLCALASVLTAALLLGPAARAGDPDFIPVASLPATVAVPDVPAAAPPQAVAVAAAAPAFTSVSSLPAPAPAASTPAAPANELPVAAPAPVAVLAFSSVSSLGAGPNATGSGPALPTAATRSLMADRILIEKGKRRLQLLSRGQVIAEYPVKLGLTPRGHKQHEGDFRTPEGVYHLSRRNPRSEFFLSVEVSYPNEADRARAKAEGLRPGGLIMIHGQPNVPRRPPGYYANNDWTDGCIAVSNSAMVDIWQRTRLGIPIEIRP